MKIYLIAGEASGDLHGAGLIQALRKKYPDAEFRGVGGDLMQAAGMSLCWHYALGNFMGFVEILKHLPAIRKNFRNTRKDIADFQPDRIILIDYPAFNLRLIKELHAKKIPVWYFISPQVWAWKESRVKMIRKYVTKLAVILPFEPQFYKKHGMDVRFVGHPLAWNISRYAGEEKLSSAPILALLPGSRKMEIKNMLPAMLESAQKYKDTYKILVAAAPGVPSELYYQASQGFDIELITGKTYAILSQAHAALVTSGTASLETGLFQVPQVVLYKANAISVAIARRLVRIKYISLVNLILNKPAVPELIQQEMRVSRIREELNKILEGPAREQQLADYQQLLHNLKRPESPYEEAVSYYIST